MTEQEAIDWCEQFRDNIIKQGIKKEKYTLALKAMRTAINALNNQAASSKWIPVTERLPEKITNKVIVLCKNGYRGFGHYENYKGKQTWYNLENDRPFTDWDLEDCESYEVTHWMPLPEPPKEV